MKTLLKIGCIALLLTAVLGCKENQSVEINTPAEVKLEKEQVPDIADVEFMDGLIGKVWHNYLEIKMALGESDADQVQQTADSMAETFSEELMNLKSLAQQLSEADDIDIQREIFARLTEEIGPLFEDALSGGTIYKMACPIAFNDKGAYWYSDVKEMSNPYFGEEMPGCGSVEKTISKESK